MAGLSIQLNRLNIGSSSLDIQQNFSPHQARASLLLSKIFSDLKISTPGAFSLKWEGDGAVLKLKDRQIQLAKNSDLKQLEQLIRYHQCTGQLPRETGEYSVHDASKNAVRTMQAARVPGQSEQVLAGLRIADDTLSITRNVLYALPAIGTNDPVVNHLGYYAGIFWTFFAVREWDSAKTELKRAELIGDQEGIRRARATMASGAIVTTGSLSYLMGRVCDSLNFVGPMTAVMRVADAFFGLGSFLSMILSGLGAYRCHSFNEKINHFLENDDLTPIEKYRGALQFLKDEVTITPQEKEELWAKVAKEFPHANEETKQKIFDRKLYYLAETKVKHIKRRTSSKSLGLILAHVDRLLGMLSDPKTQLEGVKEAALLLHEVEKENRAKMALFLISFIASLISAIAMIAATVLTAGVLPFVLYGISGTLYLALSVYSIGTMSWKKDKTVKYLTLNDAVAPLLTFN
jgi:hypothetical protein